MTAYRVRVWWLRWGSRLPASAVRWAEARAALARASQAVRHG